MTLGGNECKIVAVCGSQENCPVKEDCIIEDASGHGVIHIWGAAIDQLQDGQTHSFKNLTVKSFQGKVFLSMMPSTTFEKIANSLTRLITSILKSEDEVFVGKFKLIRNYQYLCHAKNARNILTVTKLHVESASIVELTKEQASVKERDL